MMLTREQAAAAWCPMTRVARLPGNPPGCSCVADKCAMWRWGEKAPTPRDARSWWPDEDEPTVEPPRPANVPKYAVWVPITGEGEDMVGGCWEEPESVVDAEYAAAVATRRGYCGLAGVPVIAGSEP